MYVKNSIVTDFGNFELDTNAVELHSLSGEDIKLPYTGVLPRQMHSASNAYIYFNVQVAQDVSVVLVANMKNGRQLKRPLRASNEELISLLDDFFKQTSTGLEPYYLGLWRAHYIDWRRIVTRPERLLNIFCRLPINDVNNVKMRIMECSPC